MDRRVSIKGKNARESRFSKVDSFICKAVNILQKTKDKNKPPLNKLRSKYSPSAYDLVLPVELCSLFQ